MKNEEAALESLRGLRRELEDKLQKLRIPIVKAEQDLEHVNATIALYERDKKESPGHIEAFVTGGITAFPLAKIKGLTQKQAIITIAKHNGGVLRAQDAKRLMIQAGLMLDTKNSTNMTHNVIISSEQFERIGRGEFRLKEKNLELLSPADHQSLQ